MRTDKNTRILWLVLAGMLCLSTNAQSWQWAASGGGTDALGSGYEEVYSMYTSASGDSYIASEVGRISLQVEGNPKGTYSTFGLNDWIIAG
ncbi:hypothetical protein, partial [Flavobacterium sp.]|uniref:hypothetical protein n=1 Tax=Flavobacterium sp. TaxID=239 RepID=UPI00262979BC